MDLQTQNEPLVTARQLVEKVNREEGIPLTLSRLHKLSSQGRGPKPFGKYGPANLYRPTTGLDWARRELIKPVKAA